MRVRLRDTPTDDEMAALYPEPHDAGLYGYGHSLRVGCTVELAVAVLELAALPEVTVGDLSTGNAVIPRSIAARSSAPCGLILGDFAAGYQYQGMIEHTLARLAADLAEAGRGRLDMFVLSETAEHLDDPDAVIAAIRDVSDRLILTTPIGETDAGNPEHLWGWDQAGVEDLLAHAGWRPAQRIDLVLPDTYSYQLWAANRG